MSTEFENQHPAGSFRELWHVAFPLILSSGSLSLMHVIDRVFLTWYSADALAAALPAGMLHWTVMSLSMGTVGYVTTFVAQYEGAGRRDRVSAAVWQGVYLSLFSALPYFIVAIFSDDIFALTGHAASIQKLESQYFAILCFGALPTTLSYGLSAFYNGRGQTRVVLWVNVVVTVFNAVLDYGLIFGVAGLPRMGIRGAALATVLSSVLAVALYFAMLARSNERKQYAFFKRRAFDRALFGRLLRYGLPNGFQFLADVAGFTLFVFLIGTIGKEELAATSLAFNLNSLAFIPMIGLGTAVMTLVGRRIGEQRPQLAVRSTWLAFALVAAYTLSFAAVFLLVPDEMIAIYSWNSPVAEFSQISDRVVFLLRFVALYCFFDGMAIVFGSAVRGAGDTRFSLVFGFLSGWLLMVIPATLSCLVFDASLTVCWTACTVYIVVLGFGYLLRFQAGRWQTMRVIESDHIEPDPNGSIAAAEPTATSL